MSILADLDIQPRLFKPKYTTKEMQPREAEAGCISDARGYGPQGPSRTWAVKGKQRLVVPLPSDIKRKFRCP